MGDLNYIILTESGGKVSDRDLKFPKSHEEHPQENTKRLDDSLQRKKAHRHKTNKTNNSNQTEEKHKRD